MLLASGMAQACPLFVPQQICYMQWTKSCSTLWRATVTRDFEPSYSKALRQAHATAACSCVQSFPEALSAQKPVALARSYVVADGQACTLCNSSIMNRGYQHLEARRHLRACVSN